MRLAAHHWDSGQPEQLWFSPILPGPHNVSRDLSSVPETAGC